MPPSVFQAVIADTCETAITWERFEAFHETVKAATEMSIREVAGHPGQVTCRFTHDYPDGPDPCFTLHALDPEACSTLAFCLGPMRFCSPQHAAHPPRFRFHRTLNGAAGQAAPGGRPRLRHNSSFGCQLTTARPGGCLRHCSVLRKRRGAIGRDLPAYIETVAGMSRRSAFCINLPASGAVMAKTVCHRSTGWRRSTNGGGTTIVARVFVAGGKG